MSCTRRQILAAASTLAVWPSLSAQPLWPARTVTLVIPFPAGGHTDVIGRLMAEQLSKRLQQGVVGQIHLERGFDHGCAAAGLRPDPSPRPMAAGTPRECRQSSACGLRDDERQTSRGPARSVSAALLRGLTAPACRGADFHG